MFLPSETSHSLLLPSSYFSQSLSEGRHDFRRPCFCLLRHPILRYFLLPPPSATSPIFFGNANPTKTQQKSRFIRAEKTMTATDVTGFDAIFSTGFFATFSRFQGARLTKLHKNTGEKAKKSSGEPPVETAPRNCRFLSLVVVELVLSLEAMPEQRKKALQKCDFEGQRCHLESVFHAGIVTRRVPYRPPTPENSKTQKSYSKVTFGLPAKMTQKLLQNDSKVTKTVQKVTFESL